MFPSILQRRRCRQKSPADKLNSLDYLNSSFLSPGLRFYMGILLIFSIFSTAKGQSTLKPFAGSFHSHSYYSDGNMANDPAYLRARPCFEYADQSLYVDYWGISDHNHSQAGMSKPDFRKGLLEADSVNQPGTFVSMYGMEYGIISSGGHVVIYGIDSLIGWESGNYEIYNGEYDYNGLFSKIAARPGAIAYLAHMSFDDYNNLLGNSYNPVWDSAICGMAVKSGLAFSTDTTYNDPPQGTYFQRFKEVLAKGYHVAPGVDHDSHYITFGRSSQGRTIILADTLTRTALYDAIRRRRFYATDDYNARLTFSVNNYEMGSIAEGGNNPVIHVKITDPDNEAVDEIRIYYGVAGNAIPATIIASAYNTDSLVYTHLSIANDPNYYFAEIIQSDGQRLYSAPVWYTRNNSPSSVELLSFRGEIINRHALLSWTTSSENNSDRFEVLKSPALEPYSLSGTVPAAGTSSAPLNYTYPDPELLLSATAYQLKIIDLNGDYSYSNTVVLSPVEIQDELAVFPNPSGTGNDITVMLQTDSLQHILLEVFNATGQRTSQTEFFTSSTKTAIELPAADFAAGLYLLRATNMDTRESFINRLIRQ